MPSKDHKIPQKWCSLIFFNGRTYQEQKKDLGNEECILFMVQKCTNKVRLLKSENVQNLEMDTYYKKQYKYSGYIVTGQQRKK